MEDNTQSDGLNRSELKKATISGAKWGFANQIVLQLVTLGVGIVLSRILGPKKFGLMAMVTVFTQFAFVFVDMGFSRALIHKKKVTDADLSTVFWINVIVGVFLAAVLCALSPVIAWFYGKSILLLVTIAVSSNFVISALNIVQRSMLEKELRFRALFFAGVSGHLVGRKWFGCLEPCRPVGLAFFFPCRRALDDQSLASPVCI